ncbi:MAG: crossover junction endodeoxyribonuclease RuvC [Acidimicrobiales bacterium]
MQYSPNEVKLAVAGDGAADKAQVQAMVQRLLGLASPPRPADAADAAVLALRHLAHAPARAASPGRWRGRPGDRLLRGILLDRTVGGEILVEVAGLGYRAGRPGHRGVSGRRRRRGVRGSTTTCARRPTRCTASPPDPSGTPSRPCSAPPRRGPGSSPSPIFSVHPPENLGKRPTNDAAALCLVPGVGKKTAARLLIELKTRLDVPLGDGVPPAGEDGSAVPASARADVRDALAELGHTFEEVAEATS